MYANLVVQMYYFFFQVDTKATIVIANLMQVYLQLVHLHEMDKITCCEVIINFFLDFNEYSSYTLQCTYALASFCFHG